MADDSQPRCILLPGSGKSGSKRILKIIDLAPESRCRCEPDNLAGTPPNLFPPVRIEDRTGETFDHARWGMLVDWLIRGASWRDSPPVVPKVYFRRGARALRLDALIARNGPRRALGLAVPSLRQEQWRLPAVLIADGALMQAALAIKVGNATEWLPWITANRPETMVILHLRHPGAMLASWKDRLGRHQDPETHAEVNRDRLHRVLSVSPDWVQRFGSIEQMSASVAELWYWAFSNEMLLETLGRHNRALVTLDEEVARAPTETAKRIYKHSGLTWTKNVEAFIRAKSQHWREQTVAWRRLLQPGEVKDVERVLDGSPLAEFWAENEVVSRHTYVAY